MNDAYVSYALENNFYGRVVFNLEKGRVVSIKEIWVKHMPPHDVWATVKYTPDLRIISLDTRGGYLFTFNANMSRRYEEMARIIRARAQEHL